MKPKIVVISGEGPEGWGGPGADAKPDGIGNVLVKLGAEFTGVFK